MKILLLNLPYFRPIVRRFSCTYYAKGFLFPPIELKYIAENINKMHNIKLIDCISDKINETELIKLIKKYKPDIIITLIGIESFDNDIQLINKIKSDCNSKLIVFGYYPTIFPEDILKNSKIDIIVKNEPEKTIFELIEKLNDNLSLNMQKGISYTMNGKIFNNSVQDRITKLDDIKFPRYLQVKKNYKDIFNNQRFTTVLTGRGCPFKCDFCIPTYGTEYHRRSNNNILEEIKFLIKQNITYIRFMDDTFNISEEETIELCNLILENKIKFNWACLCRIDLLNEIMISKMKQAGCKRIYFGIESTRIKNKRYFGNKSDNVYKIVRILRKYKIETIAWFLVGFPEDNKLSIKQDAIEATKLGLDFAIVSQIVPYPGTKFYEDNITKIKFSLFPYNLIYDKINLEREFYLRYYLNFTTIFKTIIFLMRYPLSTLFLILEFLKYIFYSGKKVRQSFI